MAKQIKYGIISDVHRDPRIVSLAIYALKNNGAEKLILNGDIGERKETLKESQNYIARILDYVGKSELEAWVQPGSHETLFSYNPVIEFFSEKYNNIVDATKEKKLTKEDHHLVFLPGSDFLCEGEYQIGKHQNIPSGKYIETEEGLMPIRSLEEYIYVTKKGIEGKPIHFSNMNDLEELVTAPEKTVVICHIPRKFNNTESCVDTAEFGESIRDFYLNNKEIKKNSVFPLETAIKIKELGAPIEIRKENRGNEDLRSKYEKLGITKSVSGHFHESSHKANDRRGEKVQEGQFTEELFWNSGHLDAGQTGILTVEGEKVSYQNIHLGNYFSRL